MKESDAILQAALTAAAAHITTELMRQGSTKGEQMTDEFISSAFAQAHRCVLLGDKMAQENFRAARRAKNAASSTES